MFDKLPKFYYWEVIISFLMDKFFAQMLFFARIILTIKLLAPNIRQWKLCREKTDGIRISCNYFDKFSAYFPLIVANSTDGDIRTMYPLKTVSYTYLLWTLRKMFVCIKVKV